MKENFERTLGWVKIDEGGYTNDPHDNGGPTNFGITQEDLSSWVGHKISALAVRNMSFDVAKKIYRKKYWDECSCDHLPPGIDYFTFDSGILSGTGTAIKWLQRAVGAKPDGVIGDSTLAAIEADEPLAILEKMESLRRSRLRSLSDWRHFGRGWTNRVNKSKARALKLIKEHASRK